MQVEGVTMCKESDLSLRRGLFPQLLGGNRYHTSTNYLFRAELVTVDFRVVLATSDSLRHARKTNHAI